MTTSLVFVCAHSIFHSKWCFFYTICAETQVWLYDMNNITYSRIWLKNVRVNFSIIHWHRWKQLNCCLIDSIHDSYSNVLYAIWRKMKRKDNNKKQNILCHHYLNIFFVIFVYETMARETYGRCNSWDAWISLNTHNIYILATSLSLCKRYK